MEPTLQITLGPPPQGRARDLFEEFQEKHRDGDFSGTSRWEECETELLRKFLLSRREGTLSVMEQLLSKVLEVDIVLNESKCRIGWGTNRDLWVASVFIPASGIAREDGVSLGWPLGEDIRDLIGNLIGYIFTRDWVYVAALMPETPVGRIR